MKTLLKSLMLVLACYMVFMAGYNHASHEVYAMYNECTNKTIADTRTLHGFYAHEGYRGNLMNHSKAIINHIWAECFREELYK